MLKKNKWKILISSILIILPVFIGIIFWNQLPDTMATHWGADGNPDGTMNKALAIIIPPLILLAVHLVCLIFTSLDNNRTNQNKKVMGIIYWIIPVISLFANAAMYSIALGWDVQPHNLIAPLLALMLIFIGNYMPKTTQNRTMGIKISWTLRNTENWNKTHRFAGKLWVVCGVVLLPTVFLPLKWMVPAMLLILLAIILLPFIYSYRIYKAHKKAGISYDQPVTTKGTKAARIISIIAVIAILAGVSVLMFTGDIDYIFNEESLVIEADYGEDITVSYTSIDTISYVEDSPSALRSYGFASARLSMGTFENDTFGSHTRYTYTGCKATIILESGDKVLVINQKSPTETKALYDTLLSKLP